MNDFNQADADTAGSPEESWRELQADVDRRFAEDLRHGADAAANFTGDLAALEAAARTAPAFALAAPDSRAAAEVKVLAKYVERRNNGCDAHGGHRMVSPPTVVWLAEPKIEQYGLKVDGTVETFGFHVTWTNGSWVPEIYVC